ncbi:metal ABC transporter ATP-binding protein [Tepidibacillus fermentans]|uniref:Zinc transport system ATP-binding protein n=1 Tax=Tepidibacillus fermentans TaxID=1281767 RepID=A0A4R3KIR6_9BACI|nr:metal ABC transporter ATP-binding protein [Tepidibacillus fermentans]TCS83102.1 zinc transport system ATP-binding protein [Tepidibacillus fermentans]
MPQPLIEIHNLSFQYGNNQVLNHVNLVVDEGEFFGLVGPNGSGKSTLLKIILGLLQPSNGEIKLFGQPIEQFRDWKKIGYVSQKANSFNRGFPATVEEIVETGLYGSIGLFRSLHKSDREKVKEALKLVGLEELAKRNISKLSGGQQQRVFIARAIVSQPKLLILDEPTVGVDTKSVHQFYRLMGKLNRDLGMTLILVSHDIGMVTEKVSKLACLNKQLFFHGTPKEFEQQRGVLEKTYGSEMSLVTHHHHLEES